MTAGLTLIGELIFCGWVLAFLEPLLSVAALFRRASSGLVWIGGGLAAVLP